MTLPVNEMFSTWQGEGIHMGKAAFFVRLHGCPLHCPWCDSAGTWHKDFIPTNIQRLDTVDIGKAAKDVEAEIVVITGGEPAIHDMTELTTVLSSEDFGHKKCHLETSGAFPIRGHFDFVTVSPKRAKLPLKENLVLADELKIIIDSVEAVKEWDEYLAKYYFPYVDKWNVWLHIEWSKRGSPCIAKAMSDMVKNYPNLYRIGYQLHKLFRVDSLDPRSQPPVPIGGNIKLGY